MICPNPITIRNPKKNKSASDPLTLTIPCGRCAACLSTKITDWTNRLKIALEKSNMRSYFVTLTYAGEVENVNKKHCQDFIKRLRHLTTIYKYYLISEYGPTTHRPHYHAIFIIDEERESVMNKIEKAWQHGFIEVTDCNEQRVAYMANYHASKGNSRPLYAKTFVLMSKGIGNEFLTTQVENWYRTSPRNYLQLDGVKYHMPRYYRDKLYDDDMKAYLQAEFEAVERKEYNFQEVKNFERWFRYNVIEKKNHKKHI